MDSRRIVNSDRRRLLSGSLWVLGGNLVYGLSGALIPLCVARLGGAYYVGQYMLAFAIAAPIVAVSLVQLRVLMVTDASHSVAFETYRYARFLTTLAAALVIGVAALAIGGSQGWVLAIVGLAKCLDAIGDCYLGYFQAKARLDVMGISLAVNGLVSLSLVTGLLLATGSIVGASAGTVGGSLIASIVLPLALMRRDRIRSERVKDANSLRSALRQLRIASHLGVASGLKSFGSNIPRYALQVVSGTAVQGVFSAVAQLMLLVTVTAGSVSQATLPWYVEALRTKSRRGLARVLTQTLGVVTLCGGAFAVAVAAFGESLVQRMYGSGFEISRETLVWLSLGTVLGAATWFIDGALSALRVFAPQMWLNFLGVAVTSGACVILVPQNGIVGAAQAAALGVVVDLLVRLALVGQQLSTTHEVVS